MKQTVFTGAACAIVTPFNENRKVDYKALKRLIDFQISNGTDAIVVCGTTGEGSVLDGREHKQVIKTTVKYVNGRVPVIAGTGSNSTAVAVKRSLAAQSVGADALLLVTPYYNKCSQSGLIEHYRSISDAVNLPMIVYNVPSRTGFDIMPETYAELCKIENVVAAKEANGNISALMKTITLCGDELDIYCGNDDQAAPFIAMGAKGIISVMSNILPKETHELAQAGLEGSMDICIGMQMKYMDICNNLFCDVNPIPVKFALSEMGLDSGFYRLPLTDTTPLNKAKITSSLLKYGLIQ
jgi:4-hydroxy-tetrahydrodipicolinate synthase